MRKLMFFLILITALAQKGNPFLGRWDFNTGAARANWLGVTEKGGKTEVWFQPTGGNLYEVKDFKLEGSHLTLNLGQMTWQLEPKDGKLTGVQKRGDNTSQLTGGRRPAPNGTEPNSRTNPGDLLQRRNPAAGHRM